MAILIDRHVADIIRDIEDGIDQIGLHLVGTPFSSLIAPAKHRLKIDRRLR
jgi:hypothetical protein